MKAKSGFPEVFVFLLERYFVTDKSFGNTDKFTVPPDFTVTAYLHHNKITTISYHGTPVGYGLLLFESLL